jgi:glycerol dehydrogenase-like iron-containing ADH family enzyme
VHFTAIRIYKIQAGTGAPSDRQNGSEDHCLHIAGYIVVEAAGSRLIAGHADCRSKVLSHVDCESGKEKQYGKYQARYTLHSIDLPEKELAEARELLRRAERAEEVGV